MAEDERDKEEALEAEEEIKEEQIPENPPEGRDMATSVARAIEAAFTRIARGTDDHCGNRAIRIQQQFQSMKPPIFKADDEPIKAAQWLTSIERIFKTMRLQEDDLRIENATLCLQGEAGEW